MTRVMAQRLRVIAGCVSVIAASAMCGGGGGKTPTETTPKPVDGSYTLQLFQGLAMPAHPDVNTVIDTGYAILWPSGYYMVIAVQTLNGQPSVLIRDEGYWTAASGSIQLAGQNAPVGTRLGTTQTDGHFTTAMPAAFGSGPLMTVTFVRTGEAPAPPVRPLIITPSTFVATLSTAGSGASMTFTATVTVANPDVIPRSIDYFESCRVVMLLGTDSTRIGAVNWSDDYPVNGCVPAAITDTIPPGGQKSLVDVRSVAAFNDSPFASDHLPPGRYYVWVGVYNSGFKHFGMGWITVQ